MSIDRAGSFDKKGVHGLIFGRSKRARKGKLFRVKGLPCVKCGNTKFLETLTQSKCSKCKNIRLG